MHRTILMAALLAASPGGATTVTGRSAQAVRCAAYIGMAAQYGRLEGLISDDERILMTLWSVKVLERWLPLDRPRQLAAYRNALVELGDERQSEALIGQYADWCLATFTPRL